MNRTHTSAAEWLLMLVFASAASLAGNTNYVVGGVVVDSRSNAPLARVQVSLAPTTARAQKVEQITKQDGRFSFAVSQAGKYTLQINKPGYPVQSYQAVNFVGLSSAIVVRDEQDTSHIVFQASRGGAITGQIKDEQLEPVGNALVTVFQSLIVGGERKIIQRGQTRASAAGEFRVANLHNGNYYVCAMGRPWFADSLILLQESQTYINRLPEQPEPDQSMPKFSPDPVVRDTAFSTTFYPHAETVEEASLVRLETGGEAHISITLPLAKAVSVKGTIELSGANSSGRANLFKEASGQYISFLEEVVSTDGMFQFSNVPPGSYEIVATSGAASGANSWNIRQQVEVGTSDLEIRLRPGTMGALSGRVLFDGERPPSITNLLVSLHSDEGDSLGTQVDPEGKFSLSRIPAGRFEVTAGSVDYVAAYFAGPSGERLPLTVEITSGEPVRRDLILTKAVSEIEGTVERAGVAQMGAFVLLMPKNASSRWAYRVDQTDTDGSYRLATIPPGDYLLIALTDGADVAYRDAKVAVKLTSAAKTVHIDPGDHVELKLNVVGTDTLNLP